MDDAITPPAPDGRWYFHAQEADGTPCVLHMRAKWATRFGYRPLTQAEADALAPGQAKEGIPGCEGDEHALRRLEEAAAIVNGAAANNADLEQLRDDLQELAVIVQQLASRPDIDTVERGEPADLTPIHDEIARIAHHLALTATDNQQRDTRLEEAAHRLADVPRDARLRPTPA